MNYSVTTTSHTESDFADVQFMSALEKKLTVKQWVKLLDSGFNFDQWLKSKRVYHMLMQHMGHIAHYDAHGFYHAQLAQPEDRVRFMADIVNMRHPMGFGRICMAEYEDVVTVMSEALAERHKLLVALAGDAMVENRRNEVARLENEIEGLTGGR